MCAVAPGGDGGVQRGLVVDLPLGVLAAGILQRAAQAGKEHVAPHLCGPVPGLGEVDDVGFHEKA